jgi:hypothetical protein
MKKFVMKQLPKVSTEEHLDRMEEGHKYAKVYKIARALGNSKKDSRKIAATADLAGTIKNEIQ